MNDSYTAPADADNLTVMDLIMRVCKRLGQQGERLLVVLDQFEELLIILDAGIDIIQAKVKPAAAFLQKIQGHVDRNGMDPGIEG